MNKEPAIMGIGYFTIDEDGKLTEAPHAFPQTPTDASRHSRPWVAENGMGLAWPSDWEEGPKDKKYDQGKPLVALMKRDFSKALMAVAEVTTYGVKKYNAPGSWRLVEDALERYEDAMGRHDLAHQEGQLYDDESNLLHAAHRAWGALATLEMLLEEYEVKRHDLFA